MGKAKVVVVAAAERASKCLLFPQNIGTLDLQAEVADRQTVQWAQAATWDVVCLQQYEAEGSFGCFVVATFPQQSYFRWLLGFSRDDKRRIVGTPPPSVREPAYSR